jgi:hypothetical protein
MSDSLLSLGYTSADVALKARGLCEDWTIMFAGEDISHAKEVIDAARLSLGRDKAPTSAAKVAGEVTRAYRSVRRGQLQNMHLGTYGMTMRQFVRDGKSSFPESHHLNLLYEFDRYDLGCQFLVAGFVSDESDYPCFFTVENPGVVSIYDDFGYCAIGSGSVNAMSYLSRRNQRTGTCFERSLYNAIAAKYLAEKASGVGRIFQLVIHERGKHPYFPEEKKIDAITRIWLEEEQHYSPPLLEKRIADILK